MIFFLLLFSIKDNAMTILYHFIFHLAGQIMRITPQRVEEGTEVIVQITIPLELILLILVIMIQAM